MAKRRLRLVGGINEPPVGESRRMSISDLIEGCNQAASKMGNGNPNKLLVMNCAYAMRQLVDRLAELERNDNPVNLSGTDGGPVPNRVTLI